MNRNIRRFALTIIMLFVYRIGQTITIPGISINSLGNLDKTFLDVVELVSGGQLTSFSALSLGIGPYITSTITVQIFMELIPILKRWSREKKKNIHKTIKILSIIIALFQSTALVYLFNAKYSILQNEKYFAYVVLIMVSGFTVSMWIADLISLYGIGKGPSMIIFSGAVSKIVSSAKQVLAYSNENGTKYMAVFIFLIIVIVFLTVFIENSQIRIPILSANKIKEVHFDDSNYLSLKLNPSGVIPVIFSSSIFVIPTLISVLLNKDISNFSEFLNIYTMPGVFTYGVSIVIVSIIFIDTYINVEEINDIFIKNWTYIPGIKLGEETKAYLLKALKYISVIEIVFLLTVTLLPNIVSILLNLPTYFAISGVGMVIVTNVACEIIKEIKMNTREVIYE